MGEFVVVEVKSAKTGDTWMDYSRTDANQALTFSVSAFADSKNTEFRYKHWATGDVLSDGQLAVMAEDTDKFSEWPPVVFWTVTLTYTDGHKAVGYTDAMYRIGEVILKLHVKGHGDLVSMHAE